MSRNARTTYGRLGGTLCRLIKFGRPKVKIRRITDQA